MTGTATRVKVCGITNARDARLAAAFGADAIGLIFCESPRRVDVDTARRIVRALPPFVTPVGVFVDAPLDDVLAVAAEVGLGAVQLHGSETPDYVEAVAQRVPVIKAFRVRDAGVWTSAGPTRRRRPSCLMRTSKGGWGERGMRLTGRFSAAKRGPWAPCPNRGSWQEGCARRT